MIGQILKIHLTDKRHYRNLSVFDLVERNFQLTIQVKYQDRFS